MPGIYWSIEQFRRFIFFLEHLKEQDLKSTNKVEVIEKELLLSLIDTEYVKSWTLDFLFTRYLVNHYLVFAHYTDTRHPEAAYVSLNTHPNTLARNDTVSNTQALTSYNAEGMELDTFEIYAFSAQSLWNRRLERYQKMY